jgi:hypothetical protein
MNKQKWTKDKIQELLETNDTMVVRSVLKLYEFQTLDEQDLGTASKRNGMGFNRIDAEFLSSIAEWILSGKKLSYKQLTLSRKMILKYSAQLAKIANLIEQEG